MRYRKKPVEVEAVQLLWSTWSEMCDFANVGKIEDKQPQGCWVTIDGLGGRQGHHDLWGSTDVLGLWVPTREGLMLAAEGDYIVKGTEGELYPVRPEIFAKIYEPVAYEPDISDRSARASAYREIADQRPEWVSVDDMPKGHTPI